MIPTQILPTNSSELLTTLKHLIIGTLATGLLIGAIYFSFYLFKLSRLPKQSRQYRQRSYHLESQTLIRYIITIICLLCLNLLICLFFEKGIHCLILGAGVWITYFACKTIVEFIKQRTSLRQKNQGKAEK